MNNKKYHSRSDIKRIILLITLMGGMLLAIKKMKVDICSEEFTKRNLSDADYVETLYETFLGRASDAAGKADWVGQLDAGKSRDEVMKGFAYSKEFREIMSAYGL